MENWDTFGSYVSGKGVCVNNGKFLALNFGVGKCSNNSTLSLPVYLSVCVCVCVSVCVCACVVVCVTAYAWKGEVRQWC